MFLLYILTIFISVATFSIHITVREKNLTATNPFAKMKSLTVFLFLVMIFNICDFLILYFWQMDESNVVNIIYIAEDVLEIYVACSMIYLVAENIGRKVPKWIDIVFAVAAVSALYFDILVDKSPEKLSELQYISFVMSVNIIPILILLAYSIRARIIAKKDLKKKDGRLIDSSFYVYNFFCILICIITTTNTADSQTTADFFEHDKELYLIMWFIFNIYNLVFVWRTLNVDNRTDSERIVSPEERIEYISKEYDLSDREKEIALLLYDGKNNNEMAQELFLSPNTIKVHASNIYHKLGAANRVQAVQILRGEKLNDEKEE